VKRLAGVVTDLGTYAMQFKSFFWSGSAKSCRETTVPKEAEGVFLRNFKIDLKELFDSLMIST
jgi:hypothetical protein